MGFRAAGVPGVGLPGINRSANRSASLSLSSFALLYVGLAPPARMTYVLLLSNSLQLRNCECSVHKTGDWQRRTMHGS